MTPYYAEAWAYGGIPRLATALARGLARRGHEVTVCTTDARDRTSRLARGPQPTGAPGPEATPGGVVVRIFPNVSNRLAYRLQFFTPLGLGAYLRSEARHFDAAHVHGHHHWPGAIAARHLSRAGVPYVLQPNGTGPRIERRRLAKRLFDLTLGRRGLSDAARLIAVSEAERRQLLGLGVRAAAIRLIPNPIDLGEFAAPPAPGRFRQRLGAAGQHLVLYLGTLTPRKNVDVLVAAFAAARPRDSRLVIAGNDLGAGSRLRRLVSRLGLDGLTTFTGLLRGDERLAALADADVVVYASRDEVFGLVAMEALLCGTPVIVASDSGCGELVGRMGGGRLVPPGDPTALAREIKTILGAPEVWRAAAAAAARRVRTYCGSEVVAARVETLYEELARPARLAGDAARL